MRRYRIGLFFILINAVVLMCSSFAVFVFAQETGKFTPVLEFDVMDTRTSIEKPLGRTLLLRITKVKHAYLMNFGWGVEVVRQPIQLYNTNLLYHSSDWHGPYPTDIFAWIQQEQYFPDERIIRIQGRPYEIRIRLLNCKTTGTGVDAQFISGKVKIAWRRMPVGRENKAH